MENQETATETQTPKVQSGEWNKLEGYPQKLIFELDKPVVVIFDANFTNPKEMPSADGHSVYYIFDCMNGNGDKSCIQTSAWTMLNSLKSHDPLAGKTLVITKKLVKGKNMYYVQKEGAYGTPTNITEPTKVDTEEAGINEDGSM